MFFVNLFVLKILLPPVCMAAFRKDFLFMKLCASLIEYSLANVFACDDSCRASVILSCTKCRNC